MVVRAADGKGSSAGWCEGKNMLRPDPVWSLREVTRPFPECRRGLRKASAHTHQVKEFGLKGRFC